MPGLVSSPLPPSRAMAWLTLCVVAAGGHFAVLVGTALSLLGRGAKAYRIAYLGALVSWGIVVVRPPFASEGVPPPLT